MIHLGDKAEARFTSFPPGNRRPSFMDNVVRNHPFIIGALWCGTLAVVFFPGSRDYFKRLIRGKFYVPSLSEVGRGFFTICCATLASAFAGSFMQHLTLSTFWSVVGYVLGGVLAIAFLRPHAIQGERHIRGREAVTMRERDED